MNFLKKAVFTILMAMMIFSCASANMAMNSARRKADRHEYRDAVEKTLKAMENAEGDEIAQAEMLLDTIVAEAEAYHTDRAIVAAASGEKYHFDQVWPEYKELILVRNVLATVGKEEMLKDYTAEMEENMFLAAKEYYDDGMKIYEDFQKAPNRFLAKQIINTLSNAYHIYKDGHSELPGMAGAYNEALEVAKLKVVLVYGSSVEKGGINLAHSAVAAVSPIAKNDGFIDVKDGLLVEGDFINWLDDNPQYRVGGDMSISVSPAGFKAYAKTVDADIVVYMDVSEYYLDESSDTIKVNGKVKSEEETMVSASGERTEYRRTAKVKMNFYIYDAAKNYFYGADNRVLPNMYSSFYKTIYACDYKGAIYTGDTEGFEVEAADSQDIYAQIIRSSTHGMTDEERGTDLTISEQAMYAEWLDGVEGRLAGKVETALDNLANKQFKEFLSQY